MENQNQTQEQNLSSKNTSDEQKSPISPGGKMIWLAVSIIVASVLISGSILYSGNKKGGNSLVNNNQPSVQSEKSKVSIDDDTVIGDENAPITLIEFSDFQCPFCRLFWKDTLPLIKKDYIDTGKVKFVYRDFPLSSIHPSSTIAAEAVECADEQGKFMAMHDKLFQEQDKQGQGTIQFTGEDLKKWASQIGVNTSQFNNCLDSEKYKEEVQKDTSDATAAGVTGTPAFFIGKSSTDGTVEGQLISGAQPYSVFKEKIDSLLKQ